MSDAPQKDLLRYDLMLQEALRSVLRKTLEIAADSGLPGNHHLFITFRTQAEGVEIADYLVARYQDEMTIVLQHEYWGLEIEGDQFSVTLSFSNRHERLVIPFSAVVAFADPAVNFGLQFDKAVKGEAQSESESKDDSKAAEPSKALAASSPPAEKDKEEEEAPSGNVVALDRFRKKES
ncbi:MAG: ClpXP protease specificity-enhancing factor SspB [Pseudomonadota bacterium]